MNSLCSQSCNSTPHPCHRYAACSVKEAKLECHPQQSTGGRLQRVGRCQCISHIPGPALGLPVAAPGVKKHAQCVRSVHREQVSLDISGARKRRRARGRQRPRPFKVMVSLPVVSPELAVLHPELCLPPSKLQPIKSPALPLPLSLLLHFIMIRVHS